MVGPKKRHKLEPTASSLGKKLFNDLKIASQYERPNL
jgi:hypothetical protein